MISPDTYEEVYEVLKLMDKISVMQIPEETIKYIIRNRNTHYKTRIDKNDIFNENNISKEAMDLLCYFDYNYWIDDEKKKEVDNVHKIRIQKAEEEKRKKYSGNTNIFERYEETKQDNTYPVEINESNRLLQKIKRFLEIIKEKIIGE